MTIFAINNQCIIIMKKSLFLIASICLFSFLQQEVVHASNLKASPVIINELQEFFPNDAERIELLGTLAFGNNPNAIIAEANEEAVYIQFNQNFGNVSISLYNPNGLLIHNSVVDTSVQQQVIIPIQSNVDGTYTLVLENAAGYVEGDFEEE